MTRGFARYGYGICSVAAFAQCTVAHQVHKKITEIVIDSRKAREGSLFVPLQGENTDGHRFIEDAFRRGVSAVFCQKNRVRDYLELAEKYDCGIIECDNPLSALQRLAHNYISQFSGCTYFGVTGSCGKSTTKEALSSILSAAGDTAKTPGNMNSVIGLPLSLLNVDEDTRYGVFEYGIDHVGEMERMLDVLTPDASILTNIGNSHLENFRSRRVICNEKSRIFRENSDNGFIWDGCQYRKKIERRRHVTLNTYSAQDLTSIDRQLEGTDVFVGGRLVRIPCIGEHLVTDVAAAVAMARSYGISEADIAAGLSTFRPLDGRSTIIEGDVTIIEDCYNANVDSTTSIISYVGNLDWKGRKNAVLGSMKFLGRESIRGHKIIADSIFQNHLDSAFLYGEEMESAFSYLVDQNYQGNLFYTDDFEELRDMLDGTSREGDLYLLKGSRVMAMERLISTIQGA